MYNEIEAKAKETINNIFKNENIDKLPDYNKRKMIFSYLCDNINYDYELLDKITDHNINKTKLIRDTQEEFRSVVFHNKGICNAISQYYKLLLENVNIKSYCVICDDGSPVQHALCIVYDKNNDAYSFDDVTRAIVDKKKEEFFDYDIKSANAKGQGTRKILGDDEFVMYPEDLFDYVIGRETENQSPEKLPTIKSVQKNKSSKNKNK